MSTTILDRSVQTMRAHRGRAIIGLGAIFIVATATAALLWIRPTGAPPSPATPPPPDSSLGQVPGLPPGAIECPLVYEFLTKPFDRGARGTPATSCPFVEQVRLAYANLPPGPGARQMRVPSPSTYKWYDLVCTPTGPYVTCTGGAAAIMYFYSGG